MTTEQLTALAEQVRTWTGNRAVAEQVRAAAGAFNPPKRRLDDPAERAVQIASVHLANGPMRRDVGRYFRDKDAGPYLAPFLGMEPDGSAAYHNPLTIEIADALFWLDYLRTHPVVPDQRMRRLVLEMLHMRPRVLWVPAADALVRMARVDRQVEQDLLDLCEQFPPQKRTKKGEAERRNEKRAEATERLDAKAVRKQATHMRRHVRYIAARWLAAGGDAAKLPEDLRDVPNVADPPRETTELSIEILCLAARLHSETDRPAFLPQVSSFIAKAPHPSPVIDDALRHLVGVLRQLPDANAELQTVERYLLEPAWLARCAPAARTSASAGSPPAASPHARPSANAVLSWLDSVSLIRHHRPDVLAELWERYPGARGVLDLRFWPLAIARPVDALVQHLSVIFDAGVYATTPELERALLITETVELLKHPDVHELAWPELLRRGAGSGHAATAHDGSAGDVGLADLLIWLAGPSAQAVLRRERGLEAAATRDEEKEGEDEERPDLPTYLLRKLVCEQEPLPKSAIVCLAAVKLDSDDVSTQLALHVERHLRRLHAESAEQLRLLWKILEVDPTTKFLTELYAVLPQPRGLEENAETSREPQQPTGAANEHASPLHQVIAAILAMDNAREAAVPAPGRACAAGSTPECKARIRELVQLYRELADGALHHLRLDWRGQRRHVSPSHAAEIELLLESVARAFEALDTQLHRSHACADVELLDRLGDAINGNHSCGALAEWLTWVDDSPPSLAVRFKEVDAAMRPSLSQPDDITDTRCGEAEQALSRLTAELTSCPWPEREILDCAVAHLRGWLGERRWKLEDRARLRTQLEHHLQEQQADRLVDEVKDLGDDDIRSLPAPLQQRIHEFLLERLHLLKARRFRKATASAPCDSETVHLRHELLQFGPLLVGILVGGFLMVDFGNNWNSLLQKDNEALFAWTVGFSLALAFLTLLGATVRRTAGDVARAGLRAGLIGRVFLVFAAALAAALVSACGLLFSLEGSEAAALPGELADPRFAFAQQLLLWGSLSLFLGVVLGVLGQGRGIYESRARSRDGA